MVLCIRMIMHFRVFQRSESGNVFLHKPCGTVTWSWGMAKNPFGHYAGLVSIMFHCPTSFTWVCKCYKPFVHQNWQHIHFKCNCYYIRSTNLLILTNIHFYPNKLIYTILKRFTRRDFLFTVSTAFCSHTHLRLRRFISFNIVFIDSCTPKAKAIY